MEKPDEGHEKLVLDLEVLVIEATNFAFHDFKNTKYAFPKRELVARLEKIKECVIKGEYDN